MWNWNIEMLVNLYHEYGTYWQFTVGVNLPCYNIVRVTKRKQTVSDKNYLYIAKMSTNILIVKSAETSFLYFSKFCILKSGNIFDIRMSLMLANVVC